MRKLSYLILAAALMLSGVGCGAAASEDVTEANAAVTFFKAGKADAAVVQAGEAVILIDTGLEKNADELAQSLEALGVRRIDVLIVSHFDKDHVGGADTILREFDVGAVYQSNSPKDSDEYEEYLEALEERGIEPITVFNTTETISLGGLTVEINGPAQQEYKKDPSNNSSLIVTVCCGDETVLFAGDAEDARLKEYLASYERGEGDIILKVPYHGHWQDKLTAFAEAVMPKAAIISCSKSEPEDDEREKTEALFESLGAVVYRTFEGDITLLLTSESYAITQG